MTVKLPLRLFGIEALRGAAAIAVVCTHAAKHVDLVHHAPVVMLLFRPGHAGVDLFFTISGFIILFVHRRDIGHAGEFRRYVSRRVTRIFPLYWLALGLTIAINLVGGHGLPTVKDLVYSLFLLPTAKVPILGIAWTLQLEILFYTWFSILIISRFAGALLLIIWFMAIALSSLGLGGLNAASPFCSNFNIEFFMGMISAALVQHRKIPLPRVIAASGFTAFALVYIMESAGVFDGYSISGRFAYGFSAATLVLGIAAAEQASILNITSWLRRLGGASYSIYLFQFVFIGIIWQVVVGSGLQEFLPSGMLFAVLASACIACGFLMSQLVERPMLRGVRSVHPWLRPREGARLKG